MKVSIITIVYNNEDCISKCIESVLSQTYKNIEHIVIDGGSTDGTQYKIESFKNQLAYYVSEKDNGLYNALNKGIKHATGDIVGVLHSDDMFYEPQTIAKIVTAFQTLNSDLIYANGIYVAKKDTNMVKRIYRAKPFKNKYLRFGWIPLHTTIYVKRSVFENYGVYDESYSIASDYDISLRWFQNVKLKKQFLNEWVVKMRLGGKSTTPSLQKNKSKEDLAIINKYKLLGYFTLGFKIVRKIPQYIIPKFFSNNFFL
mgnify:CR=1 FL=1